jgi:hypothetical protein
MRLSFSQPVIRGELFMAAGNGPTKPRMVTAQMM